MSKIDANRFLNPDKQYRAKPIIHDWPKGARSILMDAVLSYGYGGVVTNPSHQNGFFASAENVADFGDIIRELEEKGLPYWLYDEHGYPSGYANGRVLEGHPELESKGFYMVRRSTYDQGKHVRFCIDDETDKIVWAAKYPIRTERKHESFVEWEKMQAVPFTKDTCECDMGEFEALYIFCVKSAYEGTHCTHNVCSFSRYINILDPRAVRRFIDLAYEPIAAGVPDAYRKAGAVFTDEPALSVHYVRRYETWPYALAPFTEGLFEAYEKEYGSSMMPYLPLIFEGGTAAYAFRAQFYRLIGKLVSHSYTDQLADWCHAHGGRFSGHYLGEEHLELHVRFYGCLVEVMRHADVVGIDVLHCFPEIYHYNNAKYAQLAMRKKGSREMMVEISPFYQSEEFKKAPFENACGIAGLLFLGGVRDVKSYLRSRYDEYHEALSERTGLIDGRESVLLNEYIGRLGYMLDGLVNETGTFVYYGIESVQATLMPVHTQNGENNHPVDQSLSRLTKTVYESGYDYAFADCEDLLAAAKEADHGVPTIGDCPVKTILVPACDVMYRESLDALMSLADAGVTVLFLDQVPAHTISLGKNEIFSAEADLTPSSLQEILDHLSAAESAFTVTAEGNMLIKARYTKDGREMYFIDNNTRGKDALARFDHATKKNATVYDPTSGAVTAIGMGDYYTIPAFRGVFVLFD